jgi:hypothetical protein
MLQILTALFVFVSAGGLSVWALRRLLALDVRLTREEFDKLCKTLSVITSDDSGNSSHQVKAVSHQGLYFCINVIISFHSIQLSKPCREHNSHKTYHSQRTASSFSYSFADSSLCLQGEVSKWVEAIMSSFVATWTTSYCGPASPVDSDLTQALSVILTNLVARSADVKSRDVAVHVLKLLSLHVQRHAKKVVLETRQQPDVRDLFFHDVLRRGDGSWTFLKIYRSMIVFGKLRNFSIFQMLMLI